MRKWRLIAASSGFLWLLFGALGGHDALHGRAQGYFATAHEYHIVHTLGLFWLAGLSGGGWRWVATLWLVGIVFFSGGLYLMSVGDLSLRFVVPLGGAAFLAGWALLVVILWRQNALQERE